MGLNAAKREAERGSANLVTNHFLRKRARDRSAIPRAAGGDTKITVLSYGPQTAEDTLRKALAMKADTAALVVNDGNPNPDPLTIARVLAAAARKTRRLRS